jgi:drug/metabolite transporter (DMT)-like permease
VLRFGLYMITLNWGEQEVDAGTAAMVVTLGPILIAVLGGWLLREGFAPWLAAVCYAVGTFRLSRACRASSAPVPRHRA